MKKFICTIITLGTVLASTLCWAESDIATAPELGTAFPEDGILAVDASAAAGSRLRRILLDGSTTTFLNGSGGFTTPATSNVDDGTIDDQLIKWNTVTDKYEPFVPSDFEDALEDVIVGSATATVTRVGDTLVIASTATSSTPTIATSDPTSASATGWYLATTSGDLFYKSDDGLFSIAGSYVADAVTYTATLTIVDASALGGGVNIDSTLYDLGDSPASITGLSSATEAITYSGSDLMNCTGTAVTGTADTGPWAIDMSDSNESLTCTETAAIANLISNPNDIQGTGWVATDVTTASATTWTEDGTAVGAELVTPTFTVSIGTTYDVSYDFICSTAELRLRDNGLNRVSGDDVLQNASAVWKTVTLVMEGTDDTNDGTLRFQLDSGVISSHTGQLRNVSVVAR